MKNTQEKREIIGADIISGTVLKSEIPEHASPEMASLILKMASLMQANKKSELIKMRREIRRRLFRIRDSLANGQIPSPEYDSGLRAWMELQFNNGKLKWFQKSVDTDEKSPTYKKTIISGGFTFEWDISSEEPLKVIEPLEWDGGFDQLLYKKCNIKRCVPPAFTKQG
jgi:hypothetical protein